jgi:hypothetical protein
MRLRRLSSHSLLAHYRQWNSVRDLDKSKVTRFRGGRCDGIKARLHMEEDRYQADLRVSVGTW